jgi:hypothetical protein
MSFDKFAMSLLVTSLAIYLPSLGLMKRSKWLLTLRQLSTRGRISWSAFLTKVFIHSTRAAINNSTVSPRLFASHLCSDSISLIAAPPLAFKAETLALASATLKVSG